MRALVRAVFLTAVVLLPKVGSGQVYSFPTPPPEVTAAGAEWQLAGEPVFFEGSFYYPTGPTIFFDGNVMVRSGMHRGVPIYTDTTLIPYSMVFVPIGGAVVRPYERRREGELAGTTGSRPPSWPIQRDGDISVASRRPGIQTPPMRTFDPPVIPEASRAVGTVGAASVPPGTSVIGLTPTVTPPAKSEPPVAPVPRPTSNDGVWIEFDGSRWFASGTAVPYEPGRFTQIGDYRGFPVYRDTMGRASTIYVAVVTDGPIAPYVQR